MYMTDVTTPVAATEAEVVVETPVEATPVVETPAVEAVPAEGAAPEVTPEVAPAA